MNPVTPAGWISESHFQVDIFRVPKIEMKRERVESSLNLVEAIRVFEQRAIEEASGSDLGEVEDVVADSHAGSRGWTGSGLEDPIREVLYGEVRVRVNFDERLQSHDGEAEVKHSTERERERQWTAESVDPGEKKMNLRVQN